MTKLTATLCNFVGAKNDDISGSFGRVRELKGTCNMQDVKEKHAGAYCRTWCLLGSCVMCVCVCVCVCVSKPITTFV